MKSRHLIHKRKTDITKLVEEIHYKNRSANWDYFSDFAGQQLRRNFSRELLCVIRGSPPHWGGTFSENSDCTPMFSWN